MSASSIWRRRATEICVSTASRSLEPFAARFSELGRPQPVRDGEVAELVHVQPWFSVGVLLVDGVGEPLDGGPVPGHAQNGHGLDELARVDGPVPRDVERAEPLFHVPLLLVLPPQHLVADEAVDLRVLHRVYSLALGPGVLQNLPPPPRVPAQGRELLVGRGLALALADGEVEEVQHLATWCKRTPTLPERRWRLRGAERGRLGRGPGAALASRKGTRCKELTGVSGRRRVRTHRMLQGGPRGCPNASISKDRVFER